MIFPTPLLLFPLIAAVAVYLAFRWDTSYHRVGSRKRARIRDGQLHQYVPEKNVHQDGDEVRVSATTTRELAWIRFGSPRRLANVFYTTRAGSSGDVDHSGAMPVVYRRVDIEGQDFVRCFEAGGLWLRPSDASIAVFGDYVGPARVSEDVDTVRGREDS